MLTIPEGNEKENCKFNEYIFLRNHVSAATPTTVGFKQKKRKRRTISVQIN